MQKENLDALLSELKNDFVRARNVEECDNIQEKIDSIEHFYDQWLSDEYLSVEDIFAEIDINSVEADSYVGQFWEEAFPDSENLGDDISDFINPD